MRVSPAKPFGWKLAQLWFIVLPTPAPFKYTAMTIKVVYSITGAGVGKLLSPCVFAPKDQHMNITTYFAKKIIY